MGFSRQEYWSGLPFPSPGNLPNPGIKPGSLALEADALTSEPPGSSREMYSLVVYWLSLCAPDTGYPGFDPWVWKDPLEEGMGTNTSPGASQVA